MVLVGRPRRHFAAAESVWEIQDGNSLPFLWPHGGIEPFDGVPNAAVAPRGPSDYLTMRLFFTSLTLGTDEASLPAAFFWSAVSTNPLS